MQESLGAFNPVGHAVLAFADDKATGTPAAETFRGKGEFEVIKGHLWTLPVIGEVATRSKPRNGLTRRHPPAPATFVPHRGRCTRSARVAG